MDRGSRRINKKSGSPAGEFYSSAGLPLFLFTLLVANYIIPMPGLPAGIAGAGSLMSATTDSVVSKVDATLVAF